MIVEKSPPKLLSLRQRALAQAPGVALLLWTFLCCCFPAIDYDLWWHLKTGELIWQTGKVPQTDWYTFTCSQERWIDLHWGFQLLVAALYHLGGINLLILVKAAVTTAAVGVARSATSQGLNPGISALMWLLPAFSITGRAFERPEMLTLLFLAIWLWIIERIPTQPKLLWVLPVLQLVWTNCHALSVLGLVVGCCALVGAALQRPVPSRRFVAGVVTKSMLIWAACLTVAAEFVNPYFEEGVSFPLVLFRKLSVDREFYSRNIAEFRRPIDFLLQAGLPGLLNPYALAQLLWFIATVSSFVWLYRSRKWNWQRLLLFGGFAFLAFQAVRNANVAALVFGVVAVANIRDGLAGSSNVLGATAPLGSAGKQARTWSIRVTMLYLLLSLAVVAQLGRTLALTGGIWRQVFYESLVKPFDFGEHPAWFAHEACKFAGQSGFPRRAFISHIGVAGVYEYHNAPDRQVYMDPRLEVCTQRTFESYLARLELMSLADLRWQQGLHDAEGRMPVVILDSRNSHRAIMGLLRMPGWRLVYADSSAAVFLESKVADEIQLPRVSEAPLMHPPY